MRLHLIELLDLQSSPTVLPLSLSHHVETGRTHQKDFLIQDHDANSNLHYNSTNLTEENKLSIVP